MILGLGLAVAKMNVTESEISDDIGREWKSDNQDRKEKGGNSDN